MMNERITKATNSIDDSTCLSSDIITSCRNLILSGNLESLNASIRILKLNLQSSVNDRETIILQEYLNCSIDMRDRLLLHQADILSRDQHYDQAIKYYTDIISSSNVLIQFQAHCNLAICLYSQSRWFEAISNF